MNDWISASTSFMNYILVPIPKAANTKGQIFNPRRHTICRGCPLTELLRIQIQEWCLVRIRSFTSRATTDIIQRPLLRWIHHFKMRVSGNEPSLMYQLKKYLIIVTHDQNCYLMKCDLILHLLTIDNPEFDIHIYWNGRNCSGKQEIHVKKKLFLIFKF